jgi:hypothetical protein
MSNFINFVIGLSMANLSVQVTASALPLWQYVEKLKINIFY